MVDVASIIVAAASAVAKLIEIVAAALGEDVADIRSRVLAQVAKDAASPADATDIISGEIDSALKGP